MSIFSGPTTAPHSAELTARLGSGLRDLLRLAALLSTELSGHSGQRQIEGANAASALSLLPQPRTPNPMQRPLIAILLSLCATAALAEDDDCQVPMANWQPRVAVIQLAAANGWEVYRIKTNDGCYQIKARDALGRPIEVTLDPATLAVISTEYEALDLNDDGPDDAVPQEQGESGE